MGYETAMAPASDVTAKGQWFFFGMALVSLAVCFVGFFPTYVAPVSAGTFTRPPLVHLHGLSMLAWMLLYAVQTSLAATGRIGSHRRWGMLGPALATAGLLFLLSTMTMQFNAAAQIGPDAAARARAGAIANVPLGVLFAALVAAGVALTHRPDIHKRLMLLATIIALDPAFGRIIRVYFFGIIQTSQVQTMTSQQGLTVLVGAALALEALVFILIAHDWRIRGRPHPVSLIGAVLIVPSLLVVLPLGQTEAWQGIMLWLQHSGG